MMPVAALIFSPLGRPAADQVRVVSLSSSAAGTATETGLPAPVVWVPGFPTVIVLPAVQVNEVPPDALVLSTTVTLTVYVPAVVIVPEMTPVAELMATPGGRPLAL